MDFGMHQIDWSHQTTDYTYQQIRTISDDLICRIFQVPITLMRPVYPDSWEEEIRARMLKAHETMLLGSLIAGVVFRMENRNRFELPSFDEAISNAGRKWEQGPHWRKPVMKPKTTKAKRKQADKSRRINRK